MAITSGMSFRTDVLLNPLNIIYVTYKLRVLSLDYDEAIYKHSFPCLTTMQPTKPPRNNNAFT